MENFLALAIVAATLLGPVLAVAITRSIDDRRETKRRKLEIFRALMRSRRSGLSPDYVTALNTVEIEFAGVAPVENAHRQLLQHLNLFPQPTDWIDRLRRLQTRLLYAMATHLGYAMEQLDVLEGGYLPQAWGTAEDEQTALRRAILELLNSSRSLPVHFVSATPASSAHSVSNPPVSSPAHVDVNGLYFLEYSGISGASGYGTLQLLNGILSGNDVAGAQYHGAYKVEDGRIRGNITMRVPAGTMLVTGTHIDTETEVPIEINLPLSENQPMSQTVRVGTADVQISIQRIRN
jgi:hypothetical protein